MRHLLLILLLWIGLPISLQAQESKGDYKKMPEGFVLLSDVVPDVIQEIRYHSTYNFVGTRVDGYEEPVAIITREAAEALKAVNKELMAAGYRMKVFDTYRPQRAVSHFVRWAKVIGDTLTKQSFYPEVDKRNLFKLGFIASKSGHSRGSTIDLTLVDAKTGKEVDMGGVFDYFGERSHHTYQGISKEQQANRMRLRTVMLKHGFKPLHTEWWHFTLKNEPYPDTYFDFPIRSYRTE